jgi:hypothetical protein
MFLDNLCVTTLERKQEVRERHSVTQGLDERYFQPSEAFERYSFTKREGAVGLKGDTIAIKHSWIGIPLFQAPSVSLVSSVSHVATFGR